MNWNWMKRTDRKGNEDKKRTKEEWLQSQNGMEEIINAELKSFFFAEKFNGCKKWT